VVWWTYTTFTPDDRDTKLFSLEIQVGSFNTTPNFESWAMIRAAGEVLEELNILKIMSPNRQGTGSDGLVSKVMACISNHESKVGIPGEVESELYLSYGRDVDRVRSIASKGTVVGLGIFGWHTGSALIDGPLS
jgi:hypothetical protein